MFSMNARTLNAIELLATFGYTEHIDIIEPLRHGEAEVILSEPDGVLARHECGSWFASARTEALAEEIIDYIDTDEVLCTHGEVGLAMFMERLERPEVQHCYQVVLEHPVAVIGSKSTGMPSSGEFVFSPLDESHLELVIPYYHTAPPDYVLQRLQSGVMLGAWSGDRLAGFIGRHVEGAMGLLEVVPEFRRRGLATALEGELCRRLQEQGRVPYAHVFTDNEASLALQRKLGLSFATIQTHWLDKAEV